MGLGNLVAQGITALSGAVTGLFGSMIAEANEASRTQAQLGAVLQSTGGKAGVTAQMANELAASIQKTSTVSENAVSAGENMLLTFTGIGKDVFPQATRTMVDMATAMNGGMTPSAEQLSKTAIMLDKALQDPVTGSAALRKVGVALSEQQIEQIKAFEKSGDAMAAQKIILGELSIEFGGSAAAATHTFSGSLEMLKNTFMGVAESENGPLAGAMHSLTDTLNNPAIVSAVTSIAEVLSGALASGINFVAGLLPVLVQGWLDIQPAVQNAWEVLQGVGQVFVDLASQAGGWGSNIIDQLASGIMAGAQIVMDVLGQIGGMIADLLMPGSPPKLLPDLDKWGTGAINAYMEGWGKADFSVFGGLSDAIKGQLDSIAKATGNKDMGVASMVLGSQEAIAQAINEVHTMGNVSDETFQKIVTAAGPAGSSVVGLARSYIDLERTTQDVSNAQTELNNVTDKYKAKLAPLNADLKKIQEQKQAVQDSIQLPKLQKDMADSKTTADQRELDRLDILEIQKRQEIKTTEDARDADVSAAKSKLDNAKAAEGAAQQQVDAQKGLLDVIKKQNDMIAQETKATTGSAGAHKGAAAAEHANILTRLAPVAENVTTTVTAVNAHVTQVAATMHAALGPAITFVTGLFATMSAGFARVSAGFSAGGLVGAVEQLGTLARQIVSWLVATDTAIVAQLLRWGQAFVAWVAPSSRHCSRCWGIWPASWPAGSSSVKSRMPRCF